MGSEWIESHSFPGSLRVRARAEGARQESRGRSIMWVTEVGVQVLFPSFQTFPFEVN